MGAYTNKRDGEKAGKKQQEAADKKRQQLEAAEKAAFRAKADAEPHYLVRIDNSTTVYWRKSQIEADPQKFCRQAGLAYSKKTGLQTRQIQDYLAQNCCKPAPAQ